MISCISYDRIFLYHEYYVMQREITEACFHRTINIDIILRALHL